MGNSADNADRRTGKSSFGGSQLSASKVMKSSRKLADSKSTALRNNFSDATTEVEKMLELASLYELTRNEFESYGLLSPYNSQPFAASMRDVGHQFERTNRRFVERSRDQINRLQRRTRKQFVRDMDVTTELDAIVESAVGSRMSPAAQHSLQAILQAKKPKTGCEQPPLQPEATGFEDYLPAPPTFVPAPSPIKSIPREEPPRPPHSSASNSTKVAATINHSQTISQEPTMKQQDTHKSNGSSPQTSPRNPPSKPEQKREEDSQLKKAPPTYDLNQFEVLSDEDKSLPELVNQMSAIPEHSIEEDSEQEKEGSRGNESHRSHHQSQHHPHRSQQHSPRIGEQQAVRDAVVSDITQHVTSPKVTFVTPAAEQNKEKKSIESITVKKLKKEEAKPAERTEQRTSQKHTARMTADEAHAKQLERIDREIRSAEDDFYRLLEVSIDFDAILKKHKLNLPLDHVQEQWKQFVMGPVLDLQY